MRCWGLGLEGRGWVFAVEKGVLVEECFCEGVLFMRVFFWV